MILDDDIIDPVCCDDEAGGVIIKGLEPNKFIKVHKSIHKDVYAKFTATLAADYGYKVQTVEDESPDFLYYWITTL